MRRTGSSPFRVRATAHKSTMPLQLTQRRVSPVRAEIRNCADGFYFTDIDNCLEPRSALDPQTLSTVQHKHVGTCSVGRSTFLNGRGHMQAIRATSRHTQKNGTGTSQFHEFSRIRGTRGKPSQLQQSLHDLRKGHIHPLLRCHLARF